MLKKHVSCLLGAVMWTLPDDVAAPATRSLASFSRARREMAATVSDICVHRNLLQKLLVKDISFLSPVRVPMSLRFSLTAFPP